MSQVEVTRLSSLIVVGPPADQACVSRMSLLVLLRPGDDESEETPLRQAHVYSQKIRRA